MTADAAAGTRTFLFTDVEGSTRLLKELRERYGEVLAEHQRLLRGAVAAHGGEEVDTQGDACFFAFPTAVDGVRAAVDAQRALDAHEWSDGTSLRVRMGLHSGRASRQNGRYHGVAVHRAARIAAAAHGGQILLSQTTRELLEDEEDADEVATRDLGVHRLKDLERPARLFQVVAPDLTREFPPPRTGLAAERKRRRALLAAAALLALATVGLLAYLLLRGDAPPPEVRANTLVRIDPKTAEVAEVIPVGRRPEGVTVSGDGIWVVNGGERTVWRLDADGNVTARVGGLSGPGAIMPDGKGGVWVVGSEGEGLDALLFHINRAGLRLRTYDLHDSAIWAASFGRGYVWLTSVFEFRLDGEDHLLRFDPASGKVRSFRLGRQDLPASVAVTPEGIWMPNYRSHSLTRFDPDTARVEHFELDAPNWAPSSIAGGGNSIWAGDEGSPVVRKFDSYSGDQQDIVNVAPGEGGILVAAADEGGAWAFAPEHHRVFRIDRDGSVAARISTGRWAPAGLAASPDAVWVTVGPLPAD